MMTCLREERHHLRNVIIYFVGRMTALERNIAPSPQTLYGGCPPVS
jgi:hypothetical protein